MRGQLANTIQRDDLITLHQQNSNSHSKTALKIALILSCQTSCSPKAVAYTINELLAEVQFSSSICKIS